MTNVLQDARSGCWRHSTRSRKEEGLEEHPSISSSPLFFSATLSETWRAATQWLVLWRDSPHCTQSFELHRLRIKIDGSVKLPRFGFLAPPPSREPRGSHCVVAISHGDRSGEHVRGGGTAFKAGPAGGHPLGGGSRFLPWEHGDYHDSMGSSLPGPWQDPDHSEIGASQRAPVRGFG